MTEGVASSEALERLFEKSSMAIVVVSVLFSFGLRTLSATHDDLK